MFTIPSMPKPERRYFASDREFDVAMQHWRASEDERREMIKDSEAMMILLIALMAVGGSIAIGVFLYAIGGALLIAQTAFGVGVFALATVYAFRFVRARI